MSSKSATIDMEIAHRFIMVRKSLNLNQGQMAKACSISQARVSRIESGDRDLPVAAIKALFYSHRISPLYMITGILPIKLNLGP